MMYLKLISRHYALSGVSDIVYHYTSLSSAGNILKENQFALTFISEINCETQTIEEVEVEGSYPALTKRSGYSCLYRGKSIIL